MTTNITTDQLRRLVDELENFQQIAALLNPLPGEIPQLAGIDMHGLSLPLNGTVGGDHIIYLDFKKRYDLDARIAQAKADDLLEVAAQLELNKHRAGILVADVEGHRITDALVAAMLHQAFLLGTYYELELNGEITRRLFEHIKTRFFESININKLVAMIYGEISDRGRFRWISAGHVPPIVFSREFRRIMPLGANRTVSETLVGMFPATATPGKSPLAELRRGHEARVINEIELLSSGDILLLATDGVTEHAEGRFVPDELQRCLDEAKDRSAKEICAHLKDALLAFAPPADDISFVVIKRL